MEVLVEVADEELELVLVLVDVLLAVDVEVDVGVVLGVGEGVATVCSAESSPMGPSSVDPAPTKMCMEYTALAFQKGTDVFCTRKKAGILEKPVNTKQQ